MPRLSVVTRVLLRTALLCVILTLGGLVLSPAREASALSAYNVNRQASSGTIDSTINIANKPIYMFSGTNKTMMHHYEYVVNDGSLTVYDIDTLPNVSVVKTSALPNGTGIRSAVAWEILCG